MLAPEITVRGNDWKKRAEEANRQRLMEQWLKHSEIDPFTGQPMPGHGALKTTYPEFDLITLGQGLPIREGVSNAYNMGRRALQAAYDNGTLWDRYTTLGGRLGNWGDTFLDKAWGTAARRFGLPDEARIPGDTMRKLRETPTVSDGVVDFTGHKTWTDKPHINTTTDRFVVSHKSGWDGNDGYVFPTKTFLEQTHPTGALKSIEPSDMFANGSHVEIPTKDITLVSGDVDALRKAREAGMQTLSSPRLRKMYAREKPTNNFGKDPKGRSFWNEYAREQQRLLARRGSPTL